MPTDNQTPKAADQVPWAERITPYDEAHFVTYLRLLDAEADGADWQEVSRLVLGRDPDTDAAARRCWEDHLARAHWMTRSGYRQLLEDA
ncbi:DNA -binding domain-containing protein [Tepidicaulis sp. LMO-SS28]|uniref:DNA -binding domain-containing protein n=1 Tax=Tepidicaulis sp. LMO-SS28 TaxID=3447455 RepID=UPI003EE2F8DE